MLEILITTFLKRPYVFAFLFAYLIIAWRLLGPRWTLLNLLSGYTIAFCSEYLSINYGLPYGWYHYVYENLQGEWLNHGVPVWDSASYVFLCFAGLMTARFALQELPLEGFKNRSLLILLGALLTTLLDVVIDPLTHLGDQWFLGRIYFYPHPGWYFDVPLANFIGWFITSALINTVSLFWKTPQKKITLDCLGLYFGVLIFNISITAALRQWLLLACDFIWLTLIILIIVVLRKKQK